MVLKFAGFVLLALSAQLSLAQDSGGLTLELIEARIAALKSSGAGDDSEAVVAYAGVRALFAQVEAFNRDEQAFRESLVSAHSTMYTILLPSSGNLPRTS
jgi:hypothetical protein